MYSLFFIQKVERLRMDIIYIPNTIYNFCILKL